MKERYVTLTLTKNNEAERNGVSWPIPLNDQRRKDSRHFISLRMFPRLFIVTPKKISRIRT